MVIEISIAVVAFSFLLLVLYLIKLIKSLKSTLAQVDLTLADVRINLDNLTQEATKTTSSLHGKIDSLTPFLNTISNVGSYFEAKSRNMKIDAEVYNCHTHKKEGESPIVDQVATVFEIVGQGFRLWQDVNNRR